MGQSGYGADEETRTVAVYTEPAGTEGCGRFRRTTRGASFHIGDVFDEYPRVRPCLVITINGALQHQTRSRTTGKKE